MFTHAAQSQPKSWNHASRSSPSTQPGQEPQYSALYFSFSSNLSPQTMKGRFPDSLFCGLALLKDYKFTINSIRYANIDPSEGDHVYGALYFITAREEADLDEDNLVPNYCNKEHMEVVRLDGEGRETGQKVEALVYVDVERRDTGMIDEAYVVWMRKTVRDAKKFGLPEGYIERYIQPWLPAVKEGEEDEEREMEPVRFVFSRNQFQ